LLSAAAFSVIIRLSKPPPRERETTVQPRRITIRELLGYIVRDQMILGVLLVTIIMNNLYYPYMTILPVFARDILGRGPVGLGILGASYGVGAFLGLIVLNRIRRVWSVNRIFIVGSIFQAGLMIAFSFSASFPLSVVLSTLAGLGQSSFAVLQSSIVLISASDKMRSRTMGMLNLSIGVSAFGRMQLGALATAFGAPIALGSSCGLAIVLMAVVAVALPRFRKANRL
jgi:predicted MFS family arabinose efflux permease